jgi:hypothetical protein
MYQQFSKLTVNISVVDICAYNVLANNEKHEYLPSRIKVPNFANNLTFDID